MKLILLKNQTDFLKILSFFLLLLLLFFSVPMPAGSKQAQLTDIIVTNNHEHLLVYYYTKGCFTPDMNKAIQNGIPTTFTFLIELYKPRPLWPNIRLVSLKLHHTIKYDSLRDEYSILLSERGHQNFTVKDFTKAQEMMSDVSNIQLIPLKNLEKNTQYKVRIKAELNKVRLPLYLHYILFFVSLWDFDTDWYIVDFIY